MEADWSAECGAEDPVLVVPWSSVGTDTAAFQFIDLRENPYDIDHVLEAEQHPPLLQALRALNAGRSPVFTAKCDVWPLVEEELEHLGLILAVEPVEALHGFGSYIDLIWRERSLFVSRHRHEQLLDVLVRGSQSLHQPYAALECILRPALVDLTGPQEGFAVTLYVRAVGHDADTAYTNWSEALDGAIALVRTSDRTLIRNKTRQPLQ